jgi:hypothetical protein
VSSLRDARKQLISVRLDTGDLARLRRIAGRLRVRESDLHRYAVRRMLDRLAPLQDHDVCGIDLLPVFLECEADLLRHFDLDAERLDAIVNAGVAEKQREVDWSDLQLLALSATPPAYVVPKLRVLLGRTVHPAQVPELIRDHLRQKYAPAELAEALPPGPPAGPFTEPLTEPCGSTLAERSEDRGAPAVAEPRAVAGVDPRTSTTWVVSGRRTQER